MPQNKINSQPKDIQLAGKPECKSTFRQNRNITDILEYALTMTADL